MAGKSEKKFEQIELFSDPKTLQVKVHPPKIEPKKPFVPVSTLALDRTEIKNNFMYLIRILLNTHQKSLAQSKNQTLFIEALIQEMKIKRGLIDADLAVRSCALKTLLEKGNPR